MKTKVVGVTFPNLDGTDRQGIIEKCQAGQMAVLRHEPDNPYDSNAIAVYVQISGFLGNKKIRQIGHLSAATARNMHISEMIAYGGQLQATIAAITGGTTRRKCTLGVNLIIPQKKS